MDDQYAKNQLGMSDTTVNEQISDTLTNIVDKENNITPDVSYEPVKKSLAAQCVDTNPDNTQQKSDSLIDLCKYRRHLSENWQDTFAVYLK